MRAVPPRIRAAPGPEKRVEAARPKLAVDTHLVLLARPGVPAVTPDELIAQTRATYGGPLVVGEDLMAFEIGPMGVEVRRPGGR